ncbi:MAG: FAD-binding oxidoreductase, partial [Betaproteobacteria bacterium]|nr:FAD-binding oxidoreductase [Betaproteobacteria bacterium]
NWHRAEVLARQARRMFPQLEVKDYSRWMGVRPSTPDSAPVIGRSPRHPGVLFAFGHGHWGLMAAPATGRIIIDLVAGRTPKIDPAPFSAERFRWF